MRKFLKTALRKFGLDLIRYQKNDDFSKLRSRILSTCNPTVIDVGANSGQWAEEIRDSGWTGKIHSFEPINQYFNELKLKSRGDESWSVHNFAIGARNEQLRINIAANAGGSSSFYEIEPLVTQLQENTATVAFQETQVRRLDELDFLNSQNLLYLKADVQGFELDVIRGLGELAKRLIAIELEVSFLELYSNQPLIEQIISECRLLGFRPAQVRKGFEDRERIEILQIDLLFVKSEIAEE